MQLILLGMQNSATTAITRILNMMGVYYESEGIRISEMLQDPAGRWEKKDLRELSDNVLSAVNARWDRIANFDIQELPKVAKDQFMKKATNLVLELDVNKPWVINEPCMCLLFPLLRPLLETPVCIFINRYPVQIAQELRDSNGFPIKFSVALWEKYTISALSASAGLPRIFVSFEDILKNPVRTIEQLYTHICKYDVQGLRLPTKKEIRDFIHKNPYYFEKSDPLDHSFFNIHQKRLLESIEKKLFDQLDPPPSLSLEAIETMFQFEDKVKVETNFKKKCVNLVELGDVLDVKEREIKSLKSKLQEKDTFIQTNGREISEAKNSLQTAKNEINILKEENQSLNDKLEEQYVTLIEKAQDIEELKINNTKLQEHIFGLDDSLKTMDDELERYKSDFDQAKEDLKIKNKELQSIRETLDTTLQKADLMQKEVISYKEIQSETDTALNAHKKQFKTLENSLDEQKHFVYKQKNQLKTLENSLNHQKHSVYKLTRWLERLDNSLNLLIKSKRWTVGDNLVRMIEIALLRKKVPIAMDHIRGILKEFQDWRTLDLKKKPQLRNSN